MSAVRAKFDWRHDRHVRETARYPRRSPSRAAARRQGAPRQRLNTRFGAGQYHVPAGHLEADETVIEGIVREAREETGITFSSDDVELAYMMHFRGESDRLGLFFVVTRWSGEIRNMEPLKCAGWNWFDTDKLPENLVFYARHALLDIFSGRRLGQFGWPRRPQAAVAP